MSLDDQLTHEGKARARYLRAQLMKVEGQLAPLVDQVRDLRMRRRRIENSLNDLYDTEEYKKTYEESLAPPASKLRRNGSRTWVTKRRKS